MLTQLEEKRQRLEKAQAEADRLWQQSQEDARKAREFREQMQRAKENARSRGEAEAKRMEDLAKKALSAGNEDDARVFLAKKQQLEANGEELKKAADAARANADKMRQMHDKLVSDIEQLKARRESIKAKSAVAKTQTMVNELASGTDKAAGAIDAFNRMEAKVDKQLDTAEFLAELNEKPADDVETLEAKYAGIADSAAVDEELAKLKAEMGL